MKYKARLSDNYTLRRPFICEWNLDLIGDKLRSEFEKYLDNHKREIGWVEGTSKQLIIGPILQRFMNSKKISMVEDPRTGSLMSRFILRIGETKTLDEKSATALNVFRKRRSKLADGTFGDWQGFIEIEGDGVAQTKEETYENPTIVGADISYFSGEVDDKLETAEPAMDIVLETKPVLTCEQCKRTFKNRGVLAMHMKTHKTKK